MGSAFTDKNAYGIDDTFLGGKTTNTYTFSHLGRFMARFFFYNIKNYTSPKIDKK